MEVKSHSPITRMVIGHSIGISDRRSRKCAAQGDLDHEELPP
jgi:hypothetical protein